MRASEARVLTDEVGPELRLAGVPASVGNARGADYWPDFVATVHAALGAL